MIYADPPWRYRDGRRGHGGAEDHYRTCPLEDIKRIPVPAASDSALFLWTTMPMLPHALEVIRAWGFRYKTVAFCWVKQNRSGRGLFMGLGGWTRANAELCILATRGRPRRLSRRVHSVVVSPLQRHSQKPDEVRRRIVELMGDVPRLELFARDRAEGWDAWGNEVDGSIELRAWEPAIVARGSAADRYERRGENRRAPCRRRSTWAA